MARNQNHSSGQDRARVRVFYGEADGSSQSVEDLVRLLAVVVRPPQSVQISPAAAIAAPASPASPSQDENRPLFDGLDPNDTEPLEAVVTPPNPDTKPARRRGDGPKVARNSGIELVSGLDFVQKGKVSLKDFFAEKKPKSDIEQILVFAFYLNEIMALQDFSPGHVLSAYKHIGNLNIPLDLKCTLRNMKKKKGWLTYSDLEHMRVDTEGENVVKTVLGREKVKAK